MESFEPKKLAIIRILQILEESTDIKHPITQSEIVDRLQKDYGIVLERKAVSRNISMLKEAGYCIESGSEGSYLDYREFEDAELHLLIDAVLASRHITAKKSKELIEKLCGLSNKYFKSNIKHIHSLSDWNKTDNPTVFYSIQYIDEAIAKKLRIRFDYNKYGIDKKLHKSSSQEVSPFAMILHNQRYYLMGYNEYWNNVSFYRLDHITNMELSTESATPIKNVPGYENGINYRQFSSSMPYMYTDKPEDISFLADRGIIDQIVDWFGDSARFTKTQDENKIMVNLKSSPNAMLYWAMQYMNHVEIIQPLSLREKIRKALEEGMHKYQDQD